MNITKEQYKQALRTKGVLKERSIELLQLLNDSPNCQATSPQLAELLGYKSFSPVNALVGQLGKRIAGVLGIQSPDIEPGRPSWWNIIAHGETIADGFAWTLKEELLEALIELDLFEDSDKNLYPEIVATDPELFEGKATQVSVNAYERNTVARRICIQHYGTTCCICGFNFGDRYGEIGQGFIHVHHLVEMASIGKEYKVHPIEDLRPVCPNCHAMLHRRRPPYSIEELQALIKANSQ
jgi:5-methylcytosine-specific restriction protein A